MSSEDEKKSDEETDWDYRKDISSYYLGFSGTLAGLSFTAYYFYIDSADFSSLFVSLTALLLLITSLLFLVATIGYADCTKIYKDAIYYRKLHERQFSIKKVSWEKTIHIADMFSLIGFIIMLVALLWELSCLIYKLELSALQLFGQCSLFTW